MKEENSDYDVMIIGAGIAGIEAALTLGETGKKVLLVEKLPSVGGKMALLSKVFPTLDCCACICTPKMASVIYHPNVTLMTYCEVQEVLKNGEADFSAKVFVKPKYVDWVACTGCSMCEMACPVIIDDEFQFNMRGRKAAYIAFDIAVPKKAIIDIDNCIFCGACEKACPTSAIDFLQEPILFNVTAKAVILATGFDLFNPELKPEFGYGKSKNIITAMQMDRLLAPTRPYNTVLRPSDGKEPMKIGYLYCVGSRDKTIDNPFCSQICCMYSIKQSQLILGAIPLADVFSFYIDIRAQGKGFEEFYQQTRDMGTYFIKGRITYVDEAANGDVIVKYEDIEDGGKIKEEVFDLVVLAVGIYPSAEGIEEVFKNEKLETDIIGWIKQTDINNNPVMTNISGVFAAGCSTGPKDIPDTIVEANAAVSQCLAYIESKGEH
ncbi:MAG: FAD-dependent oxidoreductase [Candidatus Hodarchaeota archaeon]